MRLKSLSSIAFVLVSLTASAHADPILKNGSFENDFSGWTLSGGSLYAETAHGVGNYLPQDGSYYAGLGTQNVLGSLSQTFSDTAGQHYTLSYYLASNGTTPNEFRTDIDGATYFDAKDIAAQDYTQYSFDFIGTGVDTVTFYERNDPNYLALDNISVISPSLAATPEPSSLALMGTGLTAIAALARRRFRA